MFMNSSGTVFDIRRYSIHDGPGIRTAVFLKGCMLECRWCHNPEGQKGEPELIFRPNRCILCNDCLAVCQNNAITRNENEITINRLRCDVNGNCAKACSAEALEVVGQKMTVKDVLKQIECDRTFYDQSGGGVTFTGGEPLDQPHFLLDLLSSCHEIGIATAVDTSGYASWCVLDEIRSEVDLFLYDLKLMNDARHIQWTGVSNADILSNLQHLSELKQNILVRVPIIPNINDDDDNFRSMGEYLANLPQNLPVELLVYHNIAEAKYTGLGRVYGLTNNPDDKEHSKRCAEIFSEFGIQVVS
jgi:pyruvate formate lyase activating enzyme